MICVLSYQMGCLMIVVLCVEDTSPPFNPCLIKYTEIYQIVIQVCTIHLHPLNMWNYEHGNTTELFSSTN